MLVQNYLRVLALFIEQRRLITEYNYLLDLFI